MYITLRMLYKNVAKHAYYQVISMQSTIYIFMVIVYSTAVLALNVFDMTKITVCYLQ